MCLCVCVRQKVSISVIFVCLCVVNRTHAHTFRAFRGFCVWVRGIFGILKMFFDIKISLFLRYFTSNVTVLFSISTIKCVLVKANNVVCFSVCVRVKRCAHPRRPRLLCLRASSTFYCVCKSVRVGWYMFYFFLGFFFFFHIKGIFFSYKYDLCSYRWILRFYLLLLQDIFKW